MREPPNPNILPFPQTLDENEEYNFAYLQNIIQALDFLRKDAKNTGIDEIVTMIDSSFKIIYTTYYILMRHNLAQKLSS